MSSGESTTDGDAPEGAADDADSEDRSPATAEMLKKELRILGIFVLAFVSGSAVAHLNTFPYAPLMREAFDSAAETAHYLITRVPGMMRKENVNFWGTPWTDETGVTIHDEAKAFQGYTLYTSAHTRGAYLIDMDGDVVHEWSLDFTEVWPDPKHVTNYQEEWLVYWRRVHMMPDGDMLVQFYGANDTPYGYGLIKVDSESKLVWKSDVNVHHDLDIAPDGTIWSLDHQFRNLEEEPIDGVTHLAEQQLLDDGVVQFDRDGKLLRRINVYDALVRSPFRHLATLTKPGYPNDVDWDPLHTNGIAYIGPDFAAHHDYAEPGFVMFSMRRPDALAILDVENEKVVWASRGFHSHQHDPDPLPNGNVMIYDNRGHAGPEGTSRIIEFDPTTNAVEWMYTGTAEQPFESDIRSNQQLLENGNVLTCEHKKGRILEVTREGEIVWEFHSPHRDGDLVAGIGSVARYPVEYLQFEPSGAR